MYITLPKCECFVKCLHYKVYKCKCYSINGYRHLGNPNLLTNPGGNGSDLPSDPSLYANNEPFVIVCDVGSLLCAESGTHTISITGPSYTSGCIVSLAQKAIEDSEGNVISETYALKSDLESIDLSEAVDEAKAYTDEVIGNITNGTTPVAKAVQAETAVNATNATKATQDASGNVITETYETKEDAQAKLEAAAGYTHSNIYYEKRMIDSKDKAINKKISNISKTITEQNIDTAFNDIFGGE